MGGVKIRPGERKSERTPHTRGKTPPPSALTTIAIPGLNGGRAGVEVGGEEVGWGRMGSDWVGLGRKLGVGRGGRLGGRLGVGRGVGP